MQSGSEVLSQISAQINVAEGEVARTGEQLRQLGDERERLAGEGVRLLAQLAKVRLGELAASLITSGLDEADRQALALLAERQQQQRQLQQQIDEQAAKVRELGEQRGRCQQECDRAAAERQRQQQATMQRLGGDPSYQLQHAEVEQLTAQATRADAKADQAEADREHKRAPYEADKLFRYLWARRYRFPQYRAIPLLRTLDGWVAGLCGYDAAHRDYGLLLEIPERLRQHADAQAATAKAAADRMLLREQEGLAADGLPALEAALLAAQQQLAQTAAAIEAAEAAHQQSVRRRSEIDAGGDAHSRQAVAAITEQLQREDVVTLQKDAAATPTAEDDQLVQSIAALRERAQQLQSAFAEAEIPHQRAQQALNEVNDLRRRFRQQDFDAQHSMFEAGLDLPGVLRGMLSGAMTVGTGWAEMRRFQRFRRASMAPSGAEIAGNILGGILSGALRSGSRSSSSSGGFGGFGGFGGRSSGGGGFRSGGGFGGGGGGGFRTGGGF